jgi:O-antigen ligase
VVQAIPADVTVLIALLLVGVCLQRWLSGRSRPLPLGLIGLLALIGLWMVVSLIWTNAYGYGSDKTGRFVTLTALAAVAPFVLIRDRRELWQLLWWIVGIASFTALVALFSPQVEAGRLAIGTAGAKQQPTIDASRLLCAGAIILLLVPTIRRQAANRWVYPLWALSLVVIAAGIGSRGPLLALGFALGATILASALRGAGRLAPVLVAIGSAVLVFQFVSLPETSSRRLTTAAQHPLGTLQREGRSALYNTALDMIATDPVRGAGIGAYSTVTGVVAREPQRYPHNIFLELGAETGVLTALALAFAVGWVLATLYGRAWAARDPSTRQTLYLGAALLVFSLLAAQFSGDINDNRAFFAFLGLAWMLAVYGIPDRDPRAGQPHLTTKT